VAIQYGINPGTYALGLPSAEDFQRFPEVAEAGGFDAVWASEHIAWHTPIPDALTTLAVFAARTKRVRLGSSIVLLPLRHPTILAKHAASLDYVSAGRLILGVGVGGEFPQEFAATGVPVNERGRRADEALRVIRALWSQDPAPAFDGRFYQVPEITLLPRPVQPGGPPIWIGGRSDAALRRVARLGDGWIAYMVTPQRFRESMDKVRAWASEAGRDPARLVGALFIYIHVGPHEAARQANVDFLTASYRQPFDKLVDRYCVFGDAAACAAGLQPFIEAGAEHLILVPACPPGEILQQVERCAQVVALARAHR
jgi:probable F420-dependent oxidoreductase